MDYGHHWRRIQHKAAKANQIAVNAMILSRISVHPTDTVIISDNALTSLAKILSTQEKTLLGGGT